MNIAKAFALIGFITLAATGWVGVNRIVRSETTTTRLTAERARLESQLDLLRTDHSALLTRHETVLRRTAVTELVVTDGALSVVVRNADGVLRRIPTPFNPSAEIYVDYAVLDGRLWIRRIFDSFTPPDSALVIDPVIADIDWDQRPTGIGKAVYRSLGPGRWVVTVTGNGSLGLALAADDAPIELIPRPLVQQQDPVADALTPTQRTPDPR